MFQRMRLWVRVVGRVTALTLGVVACSPTFNWREARLEETPLAALLPCKPDRASRDVNLGGAQVQMRMMGCVAGGVTFAVAVVQASDADQAGVLMAQWRAATLANFAVGQVRDTPFVPKGARAMAQSVQLAGSGQQADGSPVALHAAWFAQGARVYQALAYAHTVGADVAETFFTGIALQ